MFLPRTLIIAITVVSMLLLAISVASDISIDSLLEIFLLGLLTAIGVAWVYMQNDHEQTSSKVAADPGSTSEKFGQMVGELEALRRHQRQILLDLPLGVCALDAEERITTWNGALEKMTFIDSTEIQDSKLTELQEPWLSLLHNFVTSGYTHLYKQSYELNGKKRTVNLHRSLINQSDDSKGGTSGTLILLEDITETEILEAGLTHSERLASIGRLAAGVAHEIGNPITGIACLAQNIRDEYQDEELRQMAKLIVEQTERTSRIVQSLVNFAHAGTPTNSDNSGIFPVRDCIDEAITLISLDKKGKSMLYQVECEPEIAMQGDSQRMLQVLLNLINNSRDASQPDSTIRINCQNIAKSLIITVEDNGIGIPAAVRDRIFDPFFTTKEAGDGTGLGLSLVYSIVEDLDGNIDIISPTVRETGRGTRVELTFPAPDDLPDLQEVSKTDVMNQNL
ncbi:MAG: GHKL domain-containing protein [Gammaproteobacteria bacterium]|nr:GHKL domain-containing protein [Gammaproteobacteria bacterium]